MSNLFISHSSSDSEAAKALQAQLESQGHRSVFLDLDPEVGIQAGVSWERTLYTKLRACRAVVALCSDSYLSSQWCFAEIALARMEGKDLFVLQIDPWSEGTQMPSILMEEQFIDLRTNSEDGYRRLWNGFKVKGIVPEEHREWGPDEPPYPGLQAFDESDAPIFFGRESETRDGVELINRLQRQGHPRLAMVLGSSGSGKSSLARAGIVPVLRRDTNRWLVVGPLLPGANPSRALAGALAQAFDRAGEARTWQSLLQRIEAARAGRSGSQPAAGGGPRAGSARHVLLEALDSLENELTEDDTGIVRSVRRLREFLRSRLEPRSQAAVGGPTAQEATPSISAASDSPTADGAPLDEPAGTRPGGRDVDDGGLVPAGVGAPGTGAAAVVDAEPSGCPSAPDVWAGARASDPSGGALAELARELLLLSGTSADSVVLVVDQFEELLGHDEEGPSHPTNALLCELRDALDAETSPLFVMGTMRSDYLGALQRSHPLRGLGFKSVSVGPMLPDGMRQVVEEPAKLGQIELEPGLTDRLLYDTGTPDSLPLLAFTLRAMWERFRDDRLLEIREYEQFGGLQGGIAQVADDTLDAALGGGSERRLRNAFLSLARPAAEGVGWSRQAVAWSEFDEDVQAMLQRFVDQRLLIKRADGTLEVAHEALFRSWRRLKGWLAANTAGLQLRSDIRDAAIKWRNAPSDEQVTHLWARGRLERACELRNGGDLSLETLDLEFLEASERAEQTVRRAARKRRRIKMALALGTAAVSAVATVVFGFLWKDARVMVAKAAVQEARTLSREGREPEALAYLAHALRYDASNQEARGDILSVIVDGWIMVPSHALEHDKPLKDGAFSDGGQSVVTRTDDGAQAWDVVTGLPLGAPTREPRGEADALAPVLAEAPADSAADRGDSIGADDAGFRVLLEDSAGAKLVTATSASDLPLSQWLGRDLAASMSVPPSVTLYSVVERWQLDGERWVVAESAELPVELLAAELAPAGDVLLTGAVDGQLSLWDPEALEPSGGTLSIEPPIGLARFELGGDRLVVLSGESDFVATVWDPGAAQPVVASIALGSESEAPWSDFWELGFYPGGERVATLSLSGAELSSKIDGVPDVFDNTSWVWQYGDEVDLVAVNSDWTVVATAAQGAVQVWATATGDLIADLDCGGVAELRLDAEGERLLILSDDGAAQLWDARTGGYLEELGFGHWIMQAEFSGDGRHVALLHDEAVEVWTLDGVLLSSLELPDLPGYFRFSPSGDRLITTSYAGDDEGVIRLDVLDVESGSRVGETLELAGSMWWEDLLEGEGGILTIRDEERIVDDGTSAPEIDDVAQTAQQTADKLHSLQVRPDSGRPFSTIDLEHAKPVRVALSPGGTRLAVVTEELNGRAVETRLRLWSWTEEDGRSEWARNPRQPSSRGRFRWLEFSADGDYLMAISGAGSESAEGAAPGDRGSRSAAREGLATEAELQSSDPVLAVWDWSTGRRLMRESRSVMHSAGFHPSISNDGSRVLAVHPRHLAQVWDLRTGEKLGASMKHDDDVDSARFSPDGRRILTTSGSTARLWDAASGGRAGRALAPADELAVQAETGPRPGIWVRGDHPLVTGTHGGWERVDPFRSAAPTFADHELPPEIVSYLATSPEVLMVAVSADGGSIVTSSFGHPRKLDQRRLASGVAARGSIAEFRSTSTLGPSPSDGGVEVLAAESVEGEDAPFVALRHSRGVHSVAISPAGDRIVTTSAGGHAQLWQRDGDDWRTLGNPIDLERATVYFATFSPDGERVVVVSNKTVRVLDVATQGLIGSPLIHAAPVVSAAFSQDGDHVLTSTQRPSGGDGAWTRFHWEVPVGSVSDSHLLAVMAELLGGFRVNGDGALELVPAGDRRRKLRELEALAKGSGIEALLDQVLDVNPISDVDRP